MIQFLLFFFSSISKIKHISHVNSYVVSTVVDSQILLYILKVYKTGVYNGYLFGKLLIQQNKLRVTQSLSSVGALLKAQSQP